MTRTQVATRQAKTGCEGTRCVDRWGCDIMMSSYVSVVPIWGEVLLPLGRYIASSVDGF